MNPLFQPIHFREFATEARPRPGPRSLRELQLADLVAVFVRARGASVTRLELEALRPRGDVRKPVTMPAQNTNTRTALDLVRELNELASTLRPRGRRRT
jgi:hypothetical protein